MNWSEIASLLSVSDKNQTVTVHGSKPLDFQEFSMTPRCQSAQKRASVCENALFSSLPTRERLHQTNKYPLWSAVAYGMLSRNEDHTFQVAETGRKIVAPEFSGEDAEGKIKALLTPKILSKFVGVHVC